MIESLHLYLNTNEARLRSLRGPFWKREVCDLARWNWNAGQVESLRHASLEGKGRKRALYVYAGSGLCRFGVYPCPDGLHDADEALAIGRACMQHELGLDGESWNFAVDLDRRRGLIVACAQRRSMFTALNALTAEQALRLRSVRPFAALLWNAAAPAIPAQGESTVLLLEADALTVFRQRAGKLAAAYAMAHRGDASAIERQLQRLSMSETDQPCRVTVMAWGGSDGSGAEMDASSLRSDFQDLMQAMPEAS